MSSLRPDERELMGEAEEPVTEVEEEAEEPITALVNENDNADKVVTEQVNTSEETTTEKEDKFEADLGLLGSQEGDFTVLGDKFDEVGIEVESVTITSDEVTTVVDPSVNQTQGPLSTDDSLMCLLLGMDNCNHTQTQDTTTVEPILNTGECFYNGQIYQDLSRN